MRDKHATFCLFFPDVMDGIDKTNLETCGVMRVQLFFEIANNTPDQLRYLASKGRRVILRLEEPSRGSPASVTSSYYNAANHDDMKAKVAAMKQIVPIEAVICGNEPEQEYDLRRSDDPNANWGDKPEPLFPQGRAWEHQYNLGLVRASLASIGVPVVAPGHSHKRVTPRDDPEPGRETWGRICTATYDQGPAGLHAYAINWLGDEDYNRYLWRVGEELERVHSQPWVNETNVKSSALNDGQRMQAVMSMYDLLASQTWGDVIASFCFFVSNGRADQSWSNMRIRDLAAYQALATWMAG